MNWTLPTNKENDQVIGVTTYNCERYVPKNSSISNETCSKEMFSNETKHCSEWVFDKSEETLVSEVRKTFRTIGKVHFISFS